MKADITEASSALLQGRDADVHRAWGKLRTDETGHQSKHALVDHMADVAAVFLALAKCPSIARALDKVAGRALGRRDLLRLAAVVFLHDIGKANAGFQAKQWKAVDAAPPGWPMPAGHGDEGWALLMGNPSNADQLLSCLPLEAMATWGPATLDLLQASISHHGRPVMEPPHRSDAIWRVIRSPQGQLMYDPAETLNEISLSVRKFLPEAFEHGGPPLPDKPAFAHLFAGLVQLADWLGSDTRFFAYTKSEEDRLQRAPALAQNAIKSIGLDVSELRAHLRDAAPEFSTVFQVLAPRPMQSALTNQGLGPLVILEAETGSGKTEAALWRFARLFRDGEVDSLYFALPTRVAASQLFDRLRSFAHGIWPREIAPVVVRALPGYESADGNSKISLPDFKVLWADRPDDLAAHKRWVAESPKRFLAATLAVGTVDQALLAAMEVRHAHLRHSLLSRSLLVVDEVHASDAYMTVLLERLLTAHINVGGHALLLSATLGSRARVRYLHIGAPGPVPAEPPLRQACKTPYPVINTRVDGKSRLIAVEGNPLHKTVHWEALDILSDPDRIADLAVGAAVQGARVLVIRNTVPTAVATLVGIERLISGGAASDGADWLFRVNGVSTLHHSRFSRQDRPILDAEVERQIGKHRSSTNGRIIVGTQTLEQSLDIDADLLITDLCPMDVLLQRVGRLHRHLRDASQRPGGFHEARVWVLTPEGHDLSPFLGRSSHGLGRLRDGSGVYTDLRILEATRRLVAAKPTRSIPAENRELVERATHPEALREIEEDLGEHWKRLGDTLEGEVGAKRSVANLHALPFNVAFHELHFPDRDEKIATRLGTSDRLIEFRRPPRGPFGQAVAQLALRHHQVPVDLHPDAMPENITLWDEPTRQSVGFDFTLGNAQYRYSRFGLERLKANASESKLP